MEIGKSIHTQYKTTLSLNYIPPYICHFYFLGNVGTLRKHFDVFWSCQQINSIFRQRSRTQLIFCCRRCNFQLKSCLERSGQAKTEKKLKKHVSLKRYVCQLGVGPKTRKHTLLLCVFDTSDRWKLHNQQFVGKLSKHGLRQTS